MKNYTYQNTLIGKKQLRKLLAWSFTNYNSMQACELADRLKSLGFKFASQAGISISIEDLKVPFVKNLMLEKANQEILNSEKIYLKGKITEVERLQKIISTWSLTSESLKDQVLYYFTNYDPLNSVYIMAISGARGNFSQVRQLVGMRGLMSDPSGEIMNLPIKKNFREGLTITDYLMSGYGARKGIIDTALKTANSGYLTRRLIDVGQDILIREKDCLTTHSFLLTIDQSESIQNSKIYNRILGRILSKPIYESTNHSLIIKNNVQITPQIVKELKNYQIRNFYIRSPLVCNLYRSICQKCYGWDLANENLVDLGEAIGILAGQSIGEPGTQLTMRTFHTGGIFTAEARKQIVSPLDGIIKFYKSLKTALIRTNRGEDVLVTKNSGSLLLIPIQKQTKPIQIELIRNTILFPKNNQYISKDTVIGEILNTNKQIKTEIKPILSDNCGEIFAPILKKKLNVLTNNILLWILSGQLYNSPPNSFVNFNADYKLNKNTYIFRTKVINHYKGFIKPLDSYRTVFQNQKSIEIQTEKYLLKNCFLKKLNKKYNNKNYLLEVENFKYLLVGSMKNLKLILQLNRKQKFGNLVSNSFQTLTGGTLYYDNLNKKGKNKIYFEMVYKSRPTLVFKTEKEIYQHNSYKNPLIFHKTIIWLGEEIHILNCDPNILLIKNKDFISEGFELIPGLFSKISGIVILKLKNNLIETISIKSGAVYEGKKFNSVSKKLYYPGEVILSNIPIQKLSFCEHIIGQKFDRLLIRPLELYELPNYDLNPLKLFNKKNFNRNFKMKSQTIYLYKSGQTLKGIKTLQLISNILILDSIKPIDKNFNFYISTDSKSKIVKIQTYKNLDFKNYLLPNLRYKEIQPCLLVQSNQFLDRYSVISYLESIILNSLEIVKIKIKNKKYKQILLISNKDCFSIEKKQFPEKRMNDFIIASSNAEETGKILIDNKNFFTVQKGRPYFFPNCENKDLKNDTRLQYKVLPINRVSSQIKTSRKISLSYTNLMRFVVKKDIKLLQKQNLEKYDLPCAIEFSKFFLKKNGKFYSSLIPKVLKNFSIKKIENERKGKKIIRTHKSQNFEKKKLYQTLLIQSSEIKKNKYLTKKIANKQLTLVKFLQYPFEKSTKSFGLCSITEDYFEQDINSIFRKNNEFIESGETIGLLKLEKEITGDIVQGLPRIEEILEARKKNFLLKRIPTIQKKGILIQKSSLDPNFEFRKLGASLKENDKINPHKLLKVYFNYYGLLKYFICDRKKIIKWNRLIQNYEGSYKSFKKVQTFILNSVQSVYRSQGVNINDKHLEVVIKQMTTKVIVTYEGKTPLLKKEIIDLYHIRHINKIVSTQGKQVAYYVPFLLGITKAALNNPSFISAASFQETTRVLTKAAIEGRIDWLRGLKENIITGHLIPAGTGKRQPLK